jgi:hypothetical protein
MDELQSGPLYGYPRNPSREDPSWEDALRIELS